MASRIPPLLESYFRLPPETSLILISGVLGSTTNWLVQRYLYSLLSSRKEDGFELAHASGSNVILVSFLRDYAFWKDGVGRLGLDLDVLSSKGKFVFVDGLTGLFRTSSGPHSRPPVAPNPGRRALSAATLQNLRKELDDAVAQSQSLNSGQRTALIVDQPDLLLAASGDVSTQGLRDVLLDVRERVHSTIVTLSSDEPLISSRTTSLEKEHAALALSLAHDAHFVVSLRMLDTGIARDVSGVLRVTPGGGNSDIDKEVEEQELLYFVRGDGGVRVFERGQ
ncbi:hypothetical protein F4779DRAFT_427292 [Xylariaceae sp. FL0662B]|nr:hypothetical protein F4779DRAFT_427292 [Xylariaceae sp. FL0662B]